MTDRKTVTIEKPTHQRMKEAKVAPGESFDHLINRALNALEGQSDD